MINRTNVSLPAGRPVRYAAYHDIGLAVLKILVEFREDFHEGRFRCEQRETMPVVESLIADGAVIVAATAMGTDPVPGNAGMDDADAWAMWLHRVADILPGLWD